MAILYEVIRKGLVSRALQEGRKPPLGISWGIMFQAERSAYAKVLRQECRQSEEQKGGKCADTE